MKHVHAISRMPVRGTTTAGVNSELIISFLIAILQAIKPLVVAMEPSKEQTA